MPNLSKILGGGLLVFLALAMAQEWEVFRPWLRGEKAEARDPAADAAPRAAAAAAVRELLTIASHYYASGGDPRFLERLPARGWIVDEMRADVDYLLRNGRVQEMKLVDLEMVDVTVRNERRAQVVTRERWQIRTVSAEGTGEGDPALDSALRCRYSVALVGRAWQVVEWDLALAPVDERATGGASETPATATAPGPTDPAVGGEARTP